MSWKAGDRSTWAPTSGPVLLRSGKTGPDVERPAGQWPTGRLTPRLRYAGQAARRPPAGRRPLRRWRCGPSLPRPPAYEEEPLPGERGERSGRAGAVTTTGSPD